jgi:hypothetical protein
MKANLDGTGNLSSTRIRSLDSPAHREWGVPTTLFQVFNEHINF